MAIKSPLPVIIMPIATEIDVHFWAICPADRNVGMGTEPFFFFSVFIPLIRK